MANSYSIRRFASQLLEQDEPLTDVQYQEYRRKLERALRVAERREKWAYWTVVASIVMSCTLALIGGSRLLGDFDPWSKEANIVSVLAGAVYVVSVVVFFVSLASYYSRFRPGVREAKERLRDASLLDLQRQVLELRREIAAKSSRDGAAPESPRSK